MRILFTNHRLADYTGTELFIRELASTLQTRGHQVGVFSTVPGKVAEELRGAGVETVTDLSQLSFSPQLIHGQHHLETIAALTAHPDIPAIYFCHSSSAWQEIPPMHPRIARYIGVSRRRADWMRRKHKIPPHQLGFLPNFVDLARFRHVRRPPQRLRTALLYSSTLSDPQAMAEIQAACDRCDIRLDIGGHLHGKLLSSPETVLPEYDLVFASGRSAMEAIACGCALIPVAGTRCGSMIAPCNYEAVKSLNFSTYITYPDITRQLLVKRIHRYRADACAAVTDRLRAELSLTAVVCSYESLYHEVLSSFADSSIADTADSEPAALSRYLQFLCHQAGKRGSLADSASLDLVNARKRNEALENKVTEIKELWNVTKLKREAAVQKLHVAQAKLEQVEKQLLGGPLGRMRWKRLLEKFAMIERAAEHDFSGRRECPKKR
jgi:hypothetical protein